MASEPVSRYEVVSAAQTRISGQTSGGIVWSFWRLEKSAREKASSEYRLGLRQGARECEDEEVLGGSVARSSNRVIVVACGRYGFANRTLGRERYSRRRS